MGACVTRVTYNPRVAQQEQTLASTGSATLKGQRPLRVLVVEDDQDNLRSLMLLLRSDGHDARGVGSAKAMWAQAGDFDPDAIILDINLPDASGYQVARDLRRTFGEDSARPLLIAATAWNKGADKVLAQIAGFDHHLGKPYDPSELLRILRSLPWRAS